MIVLSDIIGDAIPNSCPMKLCRPDISDIFDNSSKISTSLSFKVVITDLKYM